MNMNKNKLNGFTLIELLVVVSIIGILVAVSIFGLNGARAAGRDGKRQADLEQIRSAVEMFRADCNKYPASITAGNSIKGDGTSSSACLSGNVYLQKVPSDPNSGSYYYTGSANTFELCARLEQGGTDTCTGSCAGGACNYKITP